MHTFENVAHERRIDLDLERKKHEILLRDILDEVETTEAHIKARRKEAMINRQVY